MRISDVKLLDLEEKWEDGTLRKVIVVGPLGTYRYIYTARNVGKLTMETAHHYEGFPIVRVTGDDLRDVTACDGLWIISGHCRGLYTCDELYFEREEQAIKYIDENLNRRK